MLIKADYCSSDFRSNMGASPLFFVVLIKIPAQCVAIALLTIIFNMQMHPGGADTVDFRIGQFCHKSMPEIVYNSGSRWNLDTFKYSRRMWLLLTWHFQIRPQFGVDLSWMIFFSKGHRPTAVTPVSQYEQLRPTQQNTG